MKQISCESEFVKNKKYLCGRLNKDDKSWEMWDVMEWDKEDKVLYVSSDLFGEGYKLSDFLQVYELPTL